MINDSLYCSEDVAYPIAANAALLSISRPNGSIVLYPCRKVHVQIEEIVRDIKELETVLTSDGERYSILESCIILPLRFSRLLALKKEYWSNPTETFADANRSNPFVKSIYNFQMFSMLVTPSKDGDVWRYLAALPLPNSTSDSLIEQFMLHSDWPVAETAKHSALYSLEQPFVYNWVRHTHSPLPEISDQIGVIH